MDSTKNEWLRGLLLSHETRLLRYACKLGLSPEMSREVVQETFLRLWKEKPDSLKGRETEWLFCVCRNLSFDVKKKEGRTMKRAMKRTSSDDAHSSSQNALDDIASPNARADEMIEQHQEENAVIRAIEDLPENQQEVMRLKFQEGFSYKEISSITGLSVSHVGVLIHEAMTRLRREFAVGAQALSHGGGR